MPTAPIIQVDYDELTYIAQRFAIHALETEDLLRLIGRYVYMLETGGWSGRGADYFYDEMNMLVFPALRNLIGALEEASRATKHIRDLFGDFEREAGHIIDTADVTLVGAPYALPATIYY
jgi:WXG100 family type VII secretion target